ncbi:LuxR C-terminal-related transcriptional regulator [Streptomyces sp. NPDC049813]|uniref:LuxR C-terminal-related transcriptional regulator n=1 Tax=Streptomyces sp. NPDC049813 TaxID=3365597 RepID=UPI00378BCF48
MQVKENVDVSEAEPLVGVLEDRLPCARQTLIAVADREAAWWDTVQHSLRATAGGGGTLPRVRVLCDHIPRRAFESRDPQSGLQIRLVDEVPTQFAVFDREVAFTLVGSASVEAREEAVVESLANHFDSMWRGGRLPTGPSVPGAGRGKWADDVQITIMERLVKGDTEDKIGRSLGMSRRTVAAHVARISRRLGSTSRTQLGYLIAQSHLLDSFDLTD